MATETTAANLEVAGKKALNKAIWFPYLGTGAGMMAGAFIANKRGSGSIGYILWSTLFAGIGMAVSAKMVGSSIDSLGNILKVGDGSSSATSNDAMVEKFIAIGKKNGKDLSGKRTEIKNMIAQLTPKERAIMFDFVKVLESLPVSNPTEADAKKYADSMTALFKKHGEAEFKAFQAKADSIG